MRQKKKEQARQEEIDKASGSNTLMSSKTMKFKNMKMKQSSNVKASIIETTLEYELPTVTDSVARTLQSEAIKGKNFCKYILSLTFNRDRQS